MAIASWRSILVKFLLWFLNIFFVLTSLITILIGAKLQYDLSHRGQNSTNQTATNTTPIPGSKLMNSTSSATSVGWSLIAIGLLVFIAALFGILSVLQERSVLLTIYIYFLLACAIITVLLAILGAFTIPEILRQVRESMWEKLMHYKTHYDARYLWHSVQQWFFCCGVNSSTDWQAVIGPSGPIRAFNEIDLNKSKYPLACCQDSQHMHIDEVTNFNTTCGADKLLYHEGCFTEANIVRYKGWILSLISIGLLTLLLVLALSCFLERDRKLEMARLVCLQYAAHLNACRAKQQLQQEAQRAGKSKTSGSTSASETGSAPPVTVLALPPPTPPAQAQPSASYSLGSATQRLAQRGLSTVKAKAVQSSSVLVRRKSAVNGKAAQSSPVSVGNKPSVKAKAVRSSSDSARCNSSI